jgi:hypothetical protein
MKTALIISFLGAAISVRAASTINSVNRYAYGANIGWIDCRADGNNGAVIGEYVCSGYIYSANCGWINLGSGSPANGIYYQNNSASDFGVNHDGAGHLSGYAYGANIGWINFTNTGAPVFDLKTGILSGYAYSANCGWISLSNAMAYVQTDTVAPGADTDHNGLPDAWERQHFGHIGVDPNADPDGDGMSNLQEYLADSDPLDPKSSLRITHIGVSFFPDGRDSDDLIWTSRPTRCYRVLWRTELAAPGSWSDLGFLFSPGAGATTEGQFGFGLPAQQKRFFKVEAVKPLSP